MSIRIVIPPRFLVTPGPLLMLISVSLTSQGGLGSRVSRRPERVLDGAVARRRRLALPVVRRRSRQTARTCSVGRAFGKYLIPSAAMKYWLMTDGRSVLGVPDLVAEVQEHRERLGGTTHLVAGTARRDVHHVGVDRVCAPADQPAATTAATARQSRACASPPPMELTVTASGAARRPPHLTRVCQSNSYFGNS